MRYLQLIDTAGNIVLGDVDDKARIPVGEPLDQARGERATAAVWSPEGQWTAWSVDSDTPDGPHEIRLHDELTDSTRVLADSLSAFYLCPSPCGGYLSHLSPGPLGLELAVSEIRTRDLRIIERGQPLFWTWSPDATHIAAHVENRVVVTAIDGSESRVVTDQAGSFTSPWWMPGGSVAFVAEDRIQCSGPDGSLTTLVDGAGSGRFAVDPDGRRIALVDLFDGQQSLVVLDLLTGDREPVVTDQTVAFFWSANGRRLAVLVLAFPGRLQWVVHDGRDVVRLAPFRPGLSWLRAVLPFFEQYAQSHPVWSADGAQLVSSSLGPDGAPEALVQDVEPPYAEQRLPGVDLAWWASE